MSTAIAEESANLEAGANPATNAQSVTGGLPNLPEKTMSEKGTALIATVAVGTSVAAMAVVGTPVVIVAGILSSAVGPYVYWQQSQLADIQALKETHEAMTREVDHLGSENDRLEGVVKELSETVTKLEDVEAALDVLTNAQGESVDEFRKQVEENKKVLKKMEKNLKGNVLQNMLSVIVRCDKDGDFTIDEAEMDDLIDRIGNINGITLYEDRFRKVIKESGGSLKSVMGVVRSLLMDEESDAEPIFTLSDP